ncbi:MAG: metalloregulator ArsR/SmtB family transcription factor [Candidatus Staskawiczbacteria bacterium]|nr:metalloregulator ArsR/SmtB family transcription factor [Candidatus Staskawiczbacteria bacterium]
MEKKIDKINEFLKIIADPNRLKILVFLKNKPQCVCKIYPMLKISQKLASHHLSQLRKLDLVKQERNGNFIYYSINKKVFKKYMHILNSTIKI